MTTTLGASVAEARALFAAAGLPDSAIEARLLIGGLLGLSSTEVFVGGDRVLDGEELERIGKAVARRLKREPVHRILGAREFHGMDLKISRETLEPRPDTEVLVESLLPHVRQIVAARGAARLLDLGTGTGAIILALLKECPKASGIGSDISEDALETAAENAARLGLSDRFSAIHSRWFEKIGGAFRHNRVKSAVYKERCYPRTGTGSQGLRSPGRAGRRPRWAGRLSRNCRRCRRFPRTGRRDRRRDRVRSEGSRNRDLQLCRLHAGASSA